MNRHEQLVRDKYLKEIHETMVRHHITHEQIQEYVANRYISHADRMEEIRKGRIQAQRVRANLIKAREAKAAKKGGV